MCTSWLPLYRRPGEIPVTYMTSLITHMAPSSRSTSSGSGYMLIREQALTGQDQPGAVYTSPAKPSPAHSTTKVSHTSDDLYVIFIFIFSKHALSYGSVLLPHKKKIISRTYDLVSRTYDLLSRTYDLAKSYVRLS